MSLLTSKISEVYHSLTRTQRVVASYLMENPGSAAFATLEDLAQEIGVSTTSVIRFAQAMGYSGYSELQKCERNLLHDNASLPNRLENAAEHVRPEALLTDSFRSNLDNIRQTLDTLSSRDLELAVEAIRTARNVYLLGMRSSFSVAYYMASRLAQIKPNTHLIQSPGLLFPEQISSAGSGDLCIAFVFPHSLRHSKVAENLIRSMKRQGAEILLITNPSDNPIRDYGTIVLTCRTEGVSFKNSLAAPMCLVDYLTAAVAFADEKSAKETLERTESILKENLDLG